MTPISAFAPGRVELLGNHTDYNEGVVLGAAIDRGITVSGMPGNDGIVSLRSEFAGEIEISAADLRPQREEKRWANYSLGVLHELGRSGLPIGGFSASITGDLPAGNGLSSSAALEIATALFALKLHGRTLPALDLAKLCQRAEHSFVGVQSGLLDQVCSLFGRKDCAVFFDARSEEVQRVEFPHDAALIIAQTGVARELASGKYNDRRNETRAAANALGIRTLRDISSAQLEAAELPDLLRRRAAHIVGENERVWRAIGLLEGGDTAAFGQLMCESHESSRHNFENSSPELDLLVNIARELPGVFGARLTGGGFGGATVTLCAADRAAEIVQAMLRRYNKTTGQSPEVFVCHVDDGAH